MTTAVKNIVAIGGCNGKVRLFEQKISDLHHDGHKLGNVILKGLKSLIILSWQKTLTKRTLVSCLHGLKAEVPPSYKMISLSLNQITS